MKAYWSIGVALLSWPQIAGAQDAETRRVDIQLTNRVTYDSNVLRRPSFEEEFDDLERDDVRITPAVSLDILIPVSRQSLFLSGSLGYDFYLRNTRLNRERLSLIGGANLRAGGCTSQITGDYVRQQSDLADLFVVGAVENTEERRGIGVRLDCGGAIGITPGLGFRHETAKNSRPERQRNNYTTNSYDADIGYSRPTFGRLSVFGRYSDSEYPNRIVIGDVTDGVEVFSTGVRFEREIGSRLRGSIAGGYTWVKPKTPGAGEFSGASYSADITFMPTERLRTTIGFSREAQLSNLLDISYSITDNYRFSGEYAFGPTLRLTFGTSYTKREFEVSPLFPTAVPQTGDKSYQAFVGLTRQWNDRFSTGIDFVQERRDSSNPLIDFKSTRVGVVVSLAL